MVFCCVTRYCITIVLVESHVSGCVVYGAAERERGGGGSM